MAYGGQYIGSYAALDPGLAADYGELFTGYQLAMRRIGASTSINTANQIAEVESRLKEGISAVEIAPISQGIFEQIPKQQFKEMGQLAKLAGAEVTVHGPIIEPSGFTDRGWSERAREEAERHMISVVEKAHEINPKGNAPVTFHASAIPAEEWRTIIGEKGKEERIKDMIVAVNVESGQIEGMKREKYIYPEMKKEEYISPETRIDMHNRSQWRNTLVGVEDMKRHGDDMIGRGLSTGDLSRADIYYEDIDLKLRSMYDLAFRHGNDAVKEQLKSISKKWTDAKKEIGKADTKEKHLLLKQTLYDDVISDFNVMEEKIARARAQKGEEKEGFPIKFYKPVEEFAIEHASQTVGNVAFSAFQKFKEHTPIISVENVLPNWAFSKAESLGKLVEESRKKFVENAVAKGMHQDRAKKEAEKLIGATWDIAHINLLRAQGFSEKEIVEETKKISKYIKQVHMTDNFGMEHVDLPPGMGNVPIKKMMAEIEKAGYKGKAVIEAGSFAAQFKGVSPQIYAIEALGSPIYYPAMSPVWGQAIGTYGSANLGYGPIFPEQHFSMYGAGFSSVPLSLGGIAPGKQSRFSGAPME